MSQTEVIINSDEDEFGSDDGSGDEDIQTTTIKNSQPDQSNPILHTNTFTHSLTQQHSQNMVPGIQIQEQVQVTALNMASSESAGGTPTGSGEGADRGITVTDAYPHTEEGPEAEVPDPSAQLPRTDEYSRNINSENFLVDNKNRESEETCF